MTDFIWRALAKMDGVDLALRLTLLDLVLRPIGNGWLRVAAVGPAAVGLLLPGALRRIELWMLLTAATSARVVLDWPLPDNHAYLLSYWCLAVTLALATRDVKGFLAFNARLLIGLAFAFATLWKGVLSPDFLDGRFFQVAFLTDPRFEGIARLIGGLSPTELADWKQAVLRHADGGMLEAVPGLAPIPSIAMAARVSTAWTLAIESALALTFLWPSEQTGRRVRDALLLIFCATTYAVAPVEGFGWLLVAMGVAQCSDERVRTRALYLTVFALILVYREIPWATRLADVLVPS